MFIANKYEEIYPLKLATIYEKIAHRKLSMEQIKRKEKEILETLDFNIMFPTPFEYLTIGFQKLNLKNIMPQKNYEYLEKVSIYLLKMMTHDYEIICGQKFHELAAACIFVAFKIVEQLDGQFPLELKV